MRRRRSRCNALARFRRSRRPGGVRGATRWRGFGGHDAKAAFAVQRAGAVSRITTPRRRSRCNAAARAGVERAGPRARSARRALGCQGGPSRGDEAAFAVQRAGARSGVKGGRVGATRRRSRCNALARFRVSRRRVADEARWPCNALARSGVTGRPSRGDEAALPAEAWRRPGPRAAGPVAPETRSILSANF
jgi:hypothetical protein